MPKTSGYILFHTDACHLCEQAQALITALNIDFVLQDICDDEQLAQRYGVRIPVLLREADDAELGWPFDSHRSDRRT